MSETKNYLAMHLASKADHQASGVKGMKWGVRKPTGSKPSGRLSSRLTGKKQTPPPKKKSGPETNADRYSRLLGQAKKDGANALSDDDLAFVTKRGDAIRKVNALNEKKPGWLADAAKTALKNAAKREMQQVTANLTKKYISDELFPQSGN